MKSIFKDLLSILTYLIPFKFFPHLKRDFVYIIYQLRFRTLPKTVRDHRKFFKAEGRGFGEDAFHAAWADVIKRYRPTTALEIGVYRGQTISLWSLLGEIYGFRLNVHGLTPMNDSGDSVSSYMKLNYEEDIRKNFNYFNLPAANLVKEHSDSKVGKEFILSQIWDLVYIDGSHDYLTVLSDFELAVEAVRVGGLIVLDDSSLYTSFSRSFRGHPGPSKVVRDNMSPRLKLILSVGHNNFFVKLS